ncbi:MAG: lipoate--protein ligase [Spirochaetia bacterium]|nr:lipoate--protein ligase [Spirochaetia bacterium]
MSINLIKYYHSDNFNPYINLSFEEKLMSMVNEDELIFYLWQNENTVVIGKNQCAKDQCNLELMKKDNITLARRSSGGGAVFHDLGNLNFTFITKSENFDIKKNLEVIKLALKKYNIEAYFSGRNDLLVDGFKISGQAFLKTKNSCLHHGTLLIDVDLNNLAKYLKKDEDKLKSHGVKSHIQRVKNLSSFNETLTVNSIIDVLKESISIIYNSKLENKNFFDNELLEKYCSNSWLYRLDLDGERIRERFEYGLLDIKFKLINDIINEVKINSDIMDVNLIEEINTQLINQSFDKSLLDKIKLSDKRIESDLKKMIKGRLCMI